MSSTPGPAAGPTPGATNDAYPGRGLGLPPGGPGSIAPVGRRVVALFADWALARAISAGFFHDSGLVTLLIFALAQVVLVSTLGGGPGHVMLRLRVRRADGGPVLPLAALKRTLLLCLVIPAVIYDADQRGLHDRAADTVLVRAR